MQEAQASKQASKRREGCQYMSMHAGIELSRLNEPADYSDQRDCCCGCGCGCGCCCASIAYRLVFVLVPHAAIKQSLSLLQRILEAAGPSAHLRYPTLRLLHRQRRRCVARQHNSTAG